MKTQKDFEKSNKLAEIVSDRLIELMDKQGISEVELSTRSGVGQSTINDIKKKKTTSGRIGDAIKTPSYDKMVALANALNVSTDYLFGLSDAQTRDISVASIVAKTGLSELTINYFLTHEGFETADGYFPSADHFKTFIDFCVESYLRTQKGSLIIPLTLAVENKNLYHSLISLCYNAETESFDIKDDIVARALSDTVTDISASLYDLNKDFMILLDKFFFGEGIQDIIDKMKISLYDYYTRNNTGDENG